MKIYDMTEAEGIIVADSICDFCGESRYIAHASAETKGSDGVTTNEADICYDCAVQVAEILLGKKTIGKDGQISP